MPISSTYECKTCGKVVTRLNTKGKFCSLKCQRDFAYNQFISKWLAGDLTGAIRGKTQYPSKHIYRYFRETVGKCEMCGISEWLGKPITLELDHIDGDSSNPSRKNLRLLCPNCHSQTSTFRGRNIKN